MLPEFIDIYMSPVRDNPIIQAMLFAVLILILCDMVFGIANACAHHKFSSNKLRQGLMHKTGELVLVILGVVIDGLIFAGVNMSINGPILGVILLSIIIMEVGSLMEIAAQLNPDLQAIKAFKLLSTVKDSADKDDNMDTRIDNIESGVHVIHDSEV